MLYAGACFAQGNPSPQPTQQQLPPSLLPPHPPGKMAVRYGDIDAKRASGISPEDMLPRSREFIRLDSTYYVGWMLEGEYKQEHAADYLGFKNAIVPLEKALNLLEHDYAKALSTRSGDVMVMFPIRLIVPDYTAIAYYLMTCYSNTDQPDKVYALLRRVIKWNFQRQYYMDSYDWLGWTVHRNRYYTSAKYSFLRNSIDENEKLANHYLDTCMMLIEKNAAINEPLKKFQSGDYMVGEKMGVYHYKNILYSYSLNIDSAQYYFDLMRNAGRLPHNNYANFLVLCGNFRTAEQEYKIASYQDMGDKRLMEWVYYSSILDIYKALPKSGIALTKDIIKANGTTPGYGWYNIAEGRCMLYDGQTSEAQRYIDRAADFKEVHIGTTLGQTQYDFSVQLLKLINTEHEFEMARFEHSNWWYNPSALNTMAHKLGDKYLQQFLIINQFAQNPERDKVIYKLFSTESTVSWDEIWYLVHDFSTRYFINQFQKGAETDTRKRIRKYFALFVARLYIQQGKYDAARSMLNTILKDPTIDVDYEKLFLARIYQAQAECAREQKDETAQNDWLYRMYQTYPQLMPFCGMRMNMTLHLSGDIDPAVEKRLRACNINWVTNSSIPAPQAYVIFTKKGNKKDISYYVLDSRGNYIVKKQAFLWEKADETGTMLAYRLFNVGGDETPNP
jgi:hypothetical protein